MKLTIYIATFILICISLHGFAQDPVQKKLPVDTLTEKTQQNISGFDSLNLPQDTVPALPVSTDAFDIEIDYGARDTQWVDVVNDKIHLYGEAFCETR